MVARYLLLLIVLGLAMQLTAAVALQTDELASVGSQAFNTAFGVGNVACEISASIENGLTPGKTGNIVISLSSTVSEGSQFPANEKAVVLNGLVAVALPPGLEMAGDSRMYFYNPSTGQYEFMYSGTYPQNPLTAGLGKAIANASASNPRQIIGGLSEICEKLSPGSGFSTPSDPRINGGNPAYSVAGKSWLIPVSLMQNEIVNTFNLPDSIASEAKLRISFPFRVTGDITGSPVVVYAGGLSTGAAQVDLLPADIPAGSLPLKAVPVNSNDGQAPAPIPTIVYSYQWVAWETEFVLADYINSQLPELQDSDRFSFSGQNEGGVGNQSPKPGPEIEPTADTVLPGPVQQPEPLADTFKVPFIGFDSGETAVTPKPLPIPDPIPAPPQAETPPPVISTPEPAPTPQPPPPAATPEPTQPTAPGPGQPDSVQEVELGTIPEQDSDYRVPLKQITGSAQSSIQPIQQNWVAGELGGSPAFLDEMVFVEEGYFLMGTSNLSSAGDQDELPQTSVFLPDFYIDKYPVTNRKFYEFVIDAGYKPQGKWDKYYSKGTADLPVRGVTWNDANEYAQWAGKRLPTEAEWEKAARGVDGRLYPWGDNWSSDILPRGELIYDIMHATDAASPYGAMAMVGVFWQWTSSNFGLYPYDPDAVGDEYVLRGGCFSNGRNIVRCANRYSQPANVALNTFGFRCASDKQ